MHVDDFISDHRTDPYASFVLLYMRLPAVTMHKLRPFTAKAKLFCTFDGGRYRVTGASRLGDVWLTSDFRQDVGYETRVDVASCSAWGAEP